MDSIINSLKSLFSTYGFRAATIVVLSVVIVNLCKRPIVKLGIRLASERCYDKSVITRHISCLPFVAAFVLTAVWSLVDCGFRFAACDWSTVLSQSLTYGALAVATYETIKKQLEAYAAKKNATPTETVAKKSVKKSVYGIPRELLPAQPTDGDTETTAANCDAETVAADGTAAVTETNATAEAETNVESA